MWSAVGGMVIEECQAEIIREPLASADGTRIIGSKVTITLPTCESLTYHGLDLERVQKSTKELDDGKCRALEDVLAEIEANECTCKSLLNGHENGCPLAGDRS